MKGMEDFDLLACPLAGRLLIDASAGTGKTYTICGLVIRLLLERELPIQQILVLTYTEAATEDLRARTRAMIRLALKAFTAGRSDDPFFARLVQHHPDRNLACRRLIEALRGFDEAAIYTIHGFCQRMLKENSLESGSLFDTELITDQQHIVREIVEDFWRRHVYGGSLMFIEYAINRLSPDSLLAMLDRHLAKPSLSIIPEASEAECSGLTDAEEAFAGSFREVCRSWPAARGEVERVLLEDKGLNRKKYNPRSVPDWLAAMDAMTDRERPSPELFDKFEKFTAVEIGQSLKKGHAAPEHRFFDLCDTLWQQRRFLADHFDRCLLALKAELFSYVRQELIDRKHRLHVFAFDDLLRQLHEGLKSPNGLILAQNIRIRYPAALIDEFQDTDPLQYDIFATIYGATASGAAGQELLFLIGDPKQAIYSFRGADIFAYMQATREVGQRFTLGRNWRSDPGLIKAVNAIFKRAHDPFVYKEIPFSPVTPADKKNRSGFSINGRNDASFKLWVVQREQEDDSGKPSKPIGKEEARERILKAVAGEILRLLRLGGEHQALIGKEPVKPGDIAVLVRTNREAGMVRKALADRNIPSVLLSTESLFAAGEAEEMERLLAAIAEPSNERKIKAALVTAILGVSGEELDRMSREETPWEQWLKRFRQYNELWQQLGFVRMFRTFLTQERVRARLLALTDGERRLTNLLHLGEVLHQAQMERRLGMAGLLKFLQDKIALLKSEVMEHQLRLESDADRVRIVTIHKAKGLQYPVVFCPFSWEGSKLGDPKNIKDGVAYHQPDKPYSLVLDLAPASPQSLQLAVREELAENLRLLYVALTRAEHRCYLVWGPFRSAAGSASAYLLHQDLSSVSGDRIAETGDRMLKLSDQEIWADLEKVATDSQGSISLAVMEDGGHGRYVPSGRQQRTANSRKFQGRIATDWRIASYSALIPTRHSHADFEKIQPAAAETAAEAGCADIFSFPPGPGPGTFMHDLLEHLDFTKSDPETMIDYVKEQLLRYGYDPAWHPVLRAMLDNVLNTPLEKNRSDFTLSRISPDKRLNEMEFYFPLAPTTVGRLAGAFAAAESAWDTATAEQIGKLNFPALRGFMKGFVDLVFEFEGKFYIVDWKSNLLGNRIDDYHWKKLAEAMHSNWYTLQYHIYTVALHQYLGQRLPGYRYGVNFGGVYYIFLRGMDRRRGPEFGIFRDVPAADLVMELDRTLIG